MYSERYITFVVIINAYYFYNVRAFARLNEIGSAFTFRGHFHLPASLQNPILLAGALTP
jgi:hypothetical protein